MKPLNIPTTIAPLSSKHPLYPRWRTIINRCYNPNSVNYKRYGARGITVCDRWLSFPNFVEDMGIPDDGMHIDRVDNNLGYSPENCRWATPKQNALNRSNNAVHLVDGEEKTVSEWAECVGLKVPTLFGRLTRMGIGKALTRPLGRAQGIDFISRTILDNDSVKAIRMMEAPLKDIAQQYGVSVSTVWGIRHNKTWKHVK